MKLSGVGKAGIIVLFVNSGLSIFFSLGLLFFGLIFIDIDSYHLVGLALFFTIIGVLSLIFSVLIIIFGAVAMAKKSNGMKITCGVLGLISIIIVWPLNFFPAILALIGGILTLCGKCEEKQINQQNPYQTQTYQISSPQER